jgi:hypothetical protein
MTALDLDAIFGRIFQFNALQRTASCVVVSLLFKDCIDDEEFLVQKIITNQCMDQLWMD